MKKVLASTLLLTALILCSCGGNHRPGNKSTSRTSSSESRESSSTDIDASISDGVLEYDVIDVPLAKQIRIASYKVGRGDLTIDEAINQYGTF